MKSRAELLAELEEKRLENNRIGDYPEVFSIDEPQRGYNPYDNPSLGKEIPDDADISVPRRQLLRRNRGR